MLHIDLIENDWDASEQRRVGVIVQLDDHTVVDKDIALRHQPLVNRLLARAEGLPAEQVLTAVAMAFSGRDVTATGAHDDAECPFSHGDTTEMPHQHLGAVQLSL